MIHSVEIANYKSLKSVSCQLTSLNLMSGLNSCGKSSFIQAIRLCCSSDRRILLKGFGELRTLKSSNCSSGDEIVIAINGHRETITSLEHSNSIDSHICYLSADRFGPRTFLEVNRGAESNVVIGEFGENVADFIQEKSGDSVPKSVLHSDESNESFDEQLYEWLQEIAPGTEVISKTIYDNDISYNRINGFRPVNVGYGISYTLPVIAAALGLPRNYVFIVENPEAHLHPAGQTAMGRLLAKAAASGLQVILETHSDHVLNGVRLAIKNQELDSTAAFFHYFSLNGENNTNIQTICSDKDGRLSSWPKGFFDQAMINLGKLSRRSK